MRIGIEGQRLFRNKKHGMDMVALELIKNLQSIDSKNEYIIFVKPDEDKCIPKATNFKVVELKGGPYPTWEQFALPKAALDEGCDILHCTSNTGPVRSKVPMITIVHDMIYMESISLLNKGGSWYQKFGNMYRRWVVPKVIKRSKRITTVSNYEKDRMKNFFGLSDHKLRTVYNGVGQHFMKIENDSVLLKAKSDYKLPDHFFFFLGNTDPKKNTPNVLKAFADFNAQSNLRYKLVMLDYDETALQKVLKDIGHPEVRADIHLTGYVVNTDLPAIINQCAIFLYPSMRESFGIPILEGMACGVPVITSNTSSMPEIAADAAHIVNPNNSSEITEGMIRIMNDASYRDELCQKGIERAKVFSWKAMAENYLKLYEEIYAEL
ncbi:MAG: glycosyltransferase family 1 protein [Prolixibacteraceae bacterium]|jgi:glycosyltransferase involved in cell wall biosynthesis|nr:glycosyltransferase family 1 protein [Prolixibacteraceae bacterium]